MFESLPNTTPIGSVPNYSERGRRSSQQPRTSGGDAAADSANAEQSKRRDDVDVHLPEAIARRLLRERVLSRTRLHLELEDGEFVPRFAEDVDAEPLAAFVGRLLGAQNQLAALRVDALSQPELRARLDRALREGVAEVVEMLSSDAADEHAVAAVALVAAALDEYGRRLAELA